jgi:uncharacterized protein
MTQSNRQLVIDFFAAIPSGNVPDDLLTSDMSFWSVNGGTADKARFQGAMKILASIFADTLTYNIDSLTAEEDRVIAEVQSHGTLTNGEAIHNTHMFRFRIRDGRIASVAEFMNQLIVREKIAPLMQAAFAKASV